MNYKDTCDTIYTHFQGITNNIYAFGRHFLLLHFLSRPPIFLNDGWTGLCIKLCSEYILTYLSHGCSWRRQRAMCLRRTSSWRPSCPAHALSTPGTSLCRKWATSCSSTRETNQILVIFLVLFAILYGHNYWTEACIDAAEWTVS